MCSICTSFRLAVAPSITPPIQTNNGVIEGGLTPTNPEQFPTLVVMVILSESDQPREKWPMSVCSDALLGTPDNPFVLTAKHCVDAANLVSLTMLGCRVGQWSQTNHLRRPVSSAMLQMYGEDTNVPDVVCLYPYRSGQRRLTRCFATERSILHSFPSKVPQAAGRTPELLRLLRKCARRPNTSTIIDIAGYGLNTNKNNPGSSTNPRLASCSIWRIWCLESQEDIKRLEVGNDKANIRRHRGDPQSGRKRHPRRRFGGPMFDKHKHVVGVRVHHLNGHSNVQRAVSTTQPGVGVDRCGFEYTTV